jgi:DNA polymerase III epsilon subunit-like protein
VIRYFSVDEEFSGLDHRKNCLLSIGIVEVTEKDGAFFPDLTRKMYVELKPTGDICEQAMKINGLNVDNLTEFGVNKDNAVREINKFLNLSKDDTAVFIAYCGVLDKIFFDQLIQDVEADNPFHYEIMEISSLAIGKLGFSWGFSEKQLLDKLGIEQLTKEEKHNALNDAILQAKEFCGIMNWR